MGRRFVVLMYAPALLSGVVTIVLSFKIAATNLAIGLLVMGFGAITTVLMARRILSDRGAEQGLVDVGELRGPEFDYLIWTALGVPMFLVLALVILAITGGLSSR